MKAIKRIGRILSGIVCGIALCCVCAESANMGSQIIWTISWAAVLFLSAKLFVSLK